MLVRLSCGGSPMLLLLTQRQQKRVRIGLAKNGIYQETWRGNNVYYTVEDADRLLKLNLLNLVTRTTHCLHQNHYLR